VWTPVCMEPTLKYHPLMFDVLTLTRNPGCGQCLVGSLTGATGQSQEQAPTLQPESLATHPMQVVRYLVYKTSKAAMAQQLVEQHLQQAL